MTFHFTEHILWIKHKTLIKYQHILLVESTYYYILFSDSSDCRNNTFKHCLSFVCRHLQCSLLFFKFSLDEIFTKSNYVYRLHARWQAIHLCLCVNVSCLKMSWAKNRGSNDIERPKDNKRKSFLCHLFCTTLQLLFTQVMARLTSRVLLRFEFHAPHQILYTTLATNEKWLSYLLPKFGNQLTKNGHVLRIKVFFKYFFFKKFHK